MKKITALIMAITLILSLTAISVFAEITDADYTADGWGKDREFKVGEKWNLMYLFGKGTSANGFKFYGKAADEKELAPATYNKGGDGVQIQEVGTMTISYYQPHHWVSNSVFRAFPTAGEMTIAWTAPQTGNVTFDVEASLRNPQTAEMDGTLIKFERANGKALAKDLAVTKQGQDDGGFNKLGAPENAKAQVTFEIEKGETIYIRITNNQKCDSYLDDQTELAAWLTYNRIGENPDKPNPGTADAASIAVFVGMVALAGAYVIKKR